MHANRPIGTEDSDVDSCDVSAVRSELVADQLAAKSDSVSTDGGRLGRQGAIGHPPLWVRLARTRVRAGKIAQRTGYGRAVSAMEVLSDVVDGIFDVDGEGISANELFEESSSAQRERRRGASGRTVASLACGCTDTSDPSLPNSESPWQPPDPACVACEGKGRIRDKRRYMDSDLRAVRDEAIKVEAFGHDEGERFGCGYRWDRGSSDLPAHRPPTRSKDPEYLERWILDARSALERECPEVPKRLKSVALVHLMLSEFEVEMVSEVLRRDRPRRGTSTAALYRLKQKVDRRVELAKNGAGKPDLANESEVAMGRRTNSNTSGATYRAADLPGAKSRSSPR